MTTFSQMVDEMILELKRPDLRREIVAYLNQTVLEAHFQPASNDVIYYRANRKELRLSPDVANGYVWDLPNPSIFQWLEAARYSDVWDRDGQPVWSREVDPGKRLNDFIWYHYRMADSYVFVQHGTVIDLSYFERPPRLTYYATAERPATYNEVTGWSYLAEYDVSDEQRALARALTSNWLLLRYHDVITEGVRAKVYKRTSDDSRARTAYSMYSSLRQGLYTSESGVTGEF